RSARSGSGSRCWTAWRGAPRWASRPRAWGCCSRPRSRWPARCGSRRAASAPRARHGSATPMTSGPSMAPRLLRVPRPGAHIAALPLARPYSDLPGPLLPIRPWLPVMLPAAGFAVLWRQAPHWTQVAEVRSVTEVLLVLTAVLATLRAFGRRRWTASLRWLVVADCAMAVLLITVRAVLPGVVLMLWLAAWGGHAFLLAGELRGAAPRRGVILSLLWRIST